jgi:predicted nucleic acid-binding protein
VVRVTADTDIYISALNFGGQPDRLLHLARAGDIQVSISDDIMDELRHVLRDKFRWTEDAIILATDRLRDFTEHGKPKQKIAVVREDPNDDRILECAVAGASD